MPATKKITKSDKGKPFQVPKTYIEQIYELSGDADKYKGMFLLFLSEEGTPVIYCKYDSQIVEFGVRKALEKYLDHMDGQETSLSFEGDDKDDP